ncbi:hypothetical protein BHM03_00013293 [Ensete ventricosum]|nr:hypothetical protein BHM03_00013293 [Ensete ventricosum]
MGGGSRRVGIWGSCCGMGDGDMIMPPSLAENIQLLAHLVHYHAPHKWLQ